jgi:hypothetical protein
MERKVEQRSWKSESQTSLAGYGKRVSRSKISLQNSVNESMNSNELVEHNPKTLLRNSQPLAHICPKDNFEDKQWQSLI